MRPQHEYDEAMRLTVLGFNDCQIGRITGIPVATVQRWRTNAPGRSPCTRASPRGARPCPVCQGGDLDESRYAYLLGLYLGDGHIVSRPRGVYRLSIFLDSRYSGIIDECSTAMATAANGRDPGHVVRIGCVEVASSWKHWPCLFPQHGPGVKHRRPMGLQSWQQRIADEHPGMLLRGLIHSDGWRGVNRVRGANGMPYAYTRYQFCNESRDIQAIFCRACDVYGVAWRRMNRNTISIARRTDVAKLDLVVGPKM